MLQVTNGGRGDSDEDMDVEGSHAGITKQTFGGESFEEEVEVEDSFQSLHNGEYLDVKSGEHVRKVS